MDVVHGQTTWTILHRISVAFLLLSAGAHCGFGACTIDFHMESESVMLLEGGNASVLCDARCFAGDEPIDVSWRDERGRRIEEIPNSVFSVRYNRGLMNRLMILSAKSDITGTYVCSVMRSGSVLQMSSISVLVLGNTGNSNWYPTDTGPRRGDITPRRDLEYRPVRSVRSRLQKRDVRLVKPRFHKRDVSSSSNSASQQEFYDYGMDRLTSSASEPLGLGLEKKTEATDFQESDISSSESFQTVLAEEIRNLTGITLSDDQGREMKSGRRRTDGLWEIVSHNYGKGEDGNVDEDSMTDVNHSILDGNLNVIPADEGSYWDDFGDIENENWQNSPDIGEQGQNELGWESEGENNWNDPFNGQSWDNSPGVGEQGQSEQGWKPERESSWDDSFHGQNWDGLPGLTEQRESAIESDKGRFREINHFRGRREAPQNPGSSSKLSTLTSTEDPKSTSSSDSRDLITTTSLLSTTTGKTLTRTDEESKTTTTAATTTTETTTTETTTTTTTTTENIPVQETPNFRITTFKERQMERSTDDYKTPSTVDGMSSSSSNDGNDGRGQATKEMSDKNSKGTSKKQSATDGIFPTANARSRSQSSSPCPETETNFGRHGVLALAISVAVSFLLLYAILMILIMPRVLNRRRANREKSDPEAAIFKKKTPLGDDIAPLTLISDDNPVSDTEDEAKGKETAVDLDKTTSSESDKGDDTKSDSNSKETTAAVSTFLLRQSSQNKKDEGNANKGESKSDESKETSDKKASDSAPASKDQSEKADATSDKKPDSSNSESQKPASTTEGQSETKQTDDLLSSILPALNQSVSTSTSKDQSGSGKDTQDKADGDKKSQSESASEKEKPNGDASVDNLPPPPPTDTEKIDSKGGDNVIDV